MTTSRSERLDDLGIDLERLALTDVEVARLGASARRDRLEQLEQESAAILETAIDRLVLASGHRLAGVVGLFSGGNDSTVTCDLVRRLGLLTHTGHAHTGVGIEETRQYVRDTSAAWGVPLIERRSPNPNDAYRALVLSHGFPGAARHNLMFQRLKDHALRAVRAEVVKHPRRERVVFVAGRRRQESDRRNTVPELERIGSVAWVSPLVNWTKLDLGTYRLAYPDVPRNAVADLCHMSGECLCGSYARPGERDEIAEWFPRAFDLIAELEEILAGPAGDHLPAHVKTWGWEHDPNVEKPRRRAKPRASKPSASRICGACDARHDAEAQHATITATALPGLRLDDLAPV